MSSNKRDLSRRELFDIFRRGKSLPKALAPDEPAAAPPKPPARTLLRPPGAIFESLFPSKCMSSASCVEACPAQAIFLIADGPKAGTPAIFARQAPCVMCESLACMAACPTGALQKLGRTDVSMGVAVVEPTRCLPHLGHACVTCVSACPVPGALVLENGFPIVTNACTGCGVCERVCPTETAAIAIVPTSPI